MEKEKGKDKALGQAPAAPPAPQQAQAMNVNLALDRIKAQFPAEAGVLTAIIHKDVIVLGEHEAFALRTKDGGEIRAFKQPLELSAAEGTLVQPIFNGPFVVSAQGYEKWANAVGAQVVFPAHVLVNGEWKENKYPTIDPSNKRVTSYHVHAVAYRYTDKGILIYTDWTIIYDVQAYRLIDLLGKAKKFPQAFRLLPSDMEKPSDDGTWAKYPFDESTNLWVNTGHGEALDWYSQILNREKKSIDFAQTFARRNALKHLSGIQKAPGPQWRFPVICWRPTSGDMVKWDASDYLMLQDRVGGMITEKPHNAPVQLLVNATERIEAGSDFEEDEDLAAEGIATTPAIEVEYEEGGDGARGPEKESQSPENKSLYANLTVAVKEFPREFTAACKQMKIKVLSPDEYSVEEARDLFGVINLLVDADTVG